MRQLLGLILCFAVLTSAHGQDIDDTSILDAENQGQSIPNHKFSLQSFSSCEDMEKVVFEYLKNSLKHYQYYPYPYMREGGMMDDAVSPTLEKSSDYPAVQEDLGQGIGGGEYDMSFSDTNIQVAGVDEAEIVKTDGKYVYFYHQLTVDDYQNYAVSIAHVGTGKNINVIKRLRIPQNYSGVQMFLAESKLVLLANRYVYDSVPRFVGVNRDSQVAAIIYDISDPTKPVLERYYLVDGYLSQSRRIKDQVYILTQNSIFINPWIAYENKPAPTSADLEKTFKDEFDFSHILPNAIDVVVTDDPEKHVTTSTGKTYPFSYSRNSVAHCDQIDYYLPDSATQNEYNTQPNFLIMSVIDISDPEASVGRKVIFGDANQIYMGLDNLYIISSHYTGSRFSCPPGSMCIMPWFESYRNSIVHKFEVKKSTMNYVNSTIVPGQPLTPYAMHDDGRYFYTVNQIYSPERSSNVFVLDTKLNLAGSLRNIAPGEDFQSSRFLGDKLYLVTFEQTDPLFTIDLSNPKKPKILGELKIPGYSTYLHPYDENHLIGFGYDTIENEWGGMNNGGIKVDLYDISDFNRPLQKFTKTFGGMGSHSELSYNPRMFVWNSAKKLLMFPAQLMDQDTNSYMFTTGWQGALIVSVDAMKGIEEKTRITHIDMEQVAYMRKKACEKYAPSSLEPKCYTHVTTGEEICIEPSQREGYQSIPNYCFAEYDDSSYLANNLWNYYHEFVDRIVYVGNVIYTLSDQMIQSNTMDGDFRTLDQELWVEAVG